MKFSVFKEFRGIPINSMPETALMVIDKYLKVDLTRMIKELTTGLNLLTFVDNFQSFEVEVTIINGTELQIRNQFSDGTIPSRRIVIRGGDDSQNIVDGDTDWDANFVYLKNVGSATATATVLFLK